MSHRNTVVNSINDETAQRCVDVFRRPDDTFGFEQYRREPEDNRGWFPIGHNAGRSFADEASALQAAIAQIAWLADVTRER